MSLMSLSRAAGNTHNELDASCSSRKYGSTKTNKPRHQMNKNQHWRYAKETQESPEMSTKAHNPLSFWINKVVLDYKPKYKIKIWYWYWHPINTSIDKKKLFNKKYTWVSINLCIYPRMGRITPYNFGVGWHSDFLPTCTA